MKLIGRFIALYPKQEVLQILFVFHSGWNSFEIILIYFFFALEESMNLWIGTDYL